MSIARAIMYSSNLMNHLSHIIVILIFILGLNSTSNGMSCGDLFGVVVNTYKSTPARLTEFLALKSEKTKLMNAIKSKKSVSDIYFISRSLINLEVYLVEAGLRLSHLKESLSLTSPPSNDRVQQLELLLTKQSYFLGRVLSARTQGIDFESYMLLSYRMMIFFDLLVFLENNQKSLDLTEFLSRLNQTPNDNYFLAWSLRQPDLVSDPNDQMQIRDALNAGLVPLNIAFPVSKSDINNFLSVGVAVFGINSHMTFADVDPLPPKQFFEHDWKGHFTVGLAQFKNGHTKQYQKMLELRRQKRLSLRVNTIIDEIIFDVNHERIPFFPQSTIPEYIWTRLASGVRDNYKVSFTARDIAEQVVHRRILSWTQNDEIFKDAAPTLDEVTQAVEFMLSL